MRDCFSKVLDIGDSNIVVDDVFLGDHDGETVAYASVYGARMASEITHLFGVLGTPFVLQIGCCGALSETLVPGDLCGVTSTYCGEGASQYYKTNGKEIMASVGFADQVKLGNGESASVCSGRIYTTSALFAESREDVHRWHTQGFLAVDMETAATFAVAEYFGMERASLLYVYDCPRQGEHILLGDEDTNRRRLLGNERMIEIALMTVRNFSEQPSKSK